MYSSHRSDHNVHNLQEKQQQPEEQQQQLERSMSSSHGAVHSNHSNHNLQEGGQQREGQNDGTGEGNEQQKELGHYQDSKRQRPESNDFPWTHNFGLTQEQTKKRKEMYKKAIEFRDSARENGML